MDLSMVEYRPGEKPLDRLVEGYSYTSIFRKIAFIGDSLSSGEFQVRNPDGTSRYYDMYEYSWGQYIARKNGLTAYNFSKGGMTAREYMQTFADSKGFWARDKACQAYVIALGVNDVFNGKMEIGTLADVHPEDYTKNQPTFAGYYAQIISRYKEISPDAKFFLVSPPRMQDPEKTQTSGKLAGLFYELAGLFENTYVCDLYQYAPCYDDAFREKYFLSGHMSPAGYVLTANMIDSYIDYIIRRNYDDFKTVGFINSGIQYK